MEIERLEDMMAVQGQTPGSGSEPARCDIACTDASDGAAVYHQGLGLESIFFDDFDFGNGLTEPQMMELADALSVGDFGMLEP